ENWAVLLLHDKRRAAAADEIDEAGFLEFRVIEPKRAGSAIPAAQIKIGFGEFEGIEDDVVCGPLLGRFDAQRIEVKALAPGQQLHLHSAPEILRFDANRNVILAKRLELEFLHDARRLAFWIADESRP